MAVNTPKEKTSYYKYGQGASLPARLLVAKFYTTVEDLLSPIVPEIGSVLEVGCGEGESTKRLHSILPAPTKFCASDIDSDLVAAAKEKNPTVEFLDSESATNLKRNDKSFDLVVMLEVLEHLKDPDLVLKELSRVSIKYVLLSVPNEPLWSALNLMRGKYIKSLGNTPGHLNLWNTRSWKKILSPFFEIIQIKKPIPWQIALCRVKPH